MSISKAVSVGTVILFAGVSSGYAACDSSSLSGSYAFRVAGENLGLLDSSNALHAFQRPDGWHSDHFGYRLGQLWRWLLWGDKIGTCNGIFGCQQHE
jgi:hypothetical protein